MDERRRKLGRDLETHAELLRVRMRAGELHPGRARIAALLGDPAAGLALDTETSVLPSAEAARLTQCLEAVPYLLLGATTVCVEPWRRVHPKDETHPRAVEALGEWVRCPCEVHSRQVLDWSTGRDAIRARRRGGRGGNHDRETSRRAYDAGRSIWSAAMAHRRLQNGASDCAGFTSQTLAHAALAVGEQSLAAGLRATLVPWLLSGARTAGGLALADREGLS